MLERRRTALPGGRSAILTLASLVLVGAVVAAAPRPSDARAQTTPRTPHRLIFEARRGAVPQIYSVDPATGRNAQLTFARGGAGTPIAAPDRRLVAYDHNPAGPLAEREVRVMRPDGSRPRLVARDASLCGWMPDSRAVLYRHFGSATLMVRRLDGSAPRVYDELTGCPVWSRDGRASLRIVFPFSTLVLSRAGRQQEIAHGVSSVAWSPDGSRIAYVTNGRLTIARADGSHERTLEDSWSYSYAWAPDSRRLAVVRGSGPSSRIAVYALDGATARHLAGTTGAHMVSWSPGGVIAFTTFGASTVMRVAAGGARRLAGHRFALGLGWTRNAPSQRYRALERVLPLPSRTNIHARTTYGPVAADARTAAFGVCGEVGGWRAGTARLLRLQMARLPCIEFAVRVTSVAVAGERTAWATDRGGNVSHVTLTVRSGSTSTVVATSSTTRGSPAGAGWLLGAAPMLVFGTQSPILSCTEDRCAVTWQSVIWRVREPSWAGRCPVGEGEPGPCQQLAVYGGRAQPVAADATRVVVRTPDGDLDVLDGADGRRLLTLEAPGGGAWTAALGEGRLVVAVRGELLVHESAGGLTRLALPDAAPAVDCGSRCGADVLQLAGTARGLVAYVVGGRVFLRRLSDGADRNLGPASAARLTREGLFVVSEAADRWPGRLRFVPNAALPLR